MPILACVLLLQDLSAEDALKKIEATVRAAKTVSLNVKVSGAFEGKGSVQIKQSDKVRVVLDVEATESVGRMQASLVSDGSRMKAYCSEVGPRAREMKSPAGLGSDAATLLVLSGGLDFVQMATSLAGGEEKGFDVGQRYKVSDLKAADDPAGGSVLTFSLKIAGTEEAFETKLWYDPKTFKPIKRTCSCQPKLGHVENYPEFRLDAEIPDERFKLPADP